MVMQQWPSEDAIVETLAKEFGAAMRALLTPEDMAEVVARNARETKPGICHSHDFCDANEVLHGVFLARGMDIAEEGGRERWGRIWDAVWNLAKARGFPEA